MALWKEWSAKVGGVLRQGGRRAEVLCRNLNGVKESGFECLGRGNSKQKERLLTSAELGMIEEE